jgi:hypothetical protein
MQSATLAREFESVDQDLSQVGGCRSMELSRRDLFIEGVRVFERVLPRQPDSGGG